MPAGVRSEAALLPFRAGTAVEPVVAHPVEVRAATLAAPTQARAVARRAAGRAKRPRMAVGPRLWGGALVAGFAVIAAIQPGTDVRPPTQPGWVDVASVLSLGLLAVAVAALLAGRRWGIEPATYGSAGLVALSALCPAWQHHHIGAWWVAQSVISTAMFGGSVALRYRPAEAAAWPAPLGGADR